MKAFITGGTGYIGKHVVRKLVAREYEVVALVRSEKGAAGLDALGALPIRGDINDCESMREAMRGCDVVLHLAGWYRIGARDQTIAEIINVEGTRNVLELAYEMGIPKIIHTSTLTVNGDTKGLIADESYHMPLGQQFITEYDRTKWMAHHRVALPLIEKGAPIIILMPGVVYGPGDHSLAGDMMRGFYKGFFLFFPGPETTLTYAHVEDIAEAHLLAIEKGKPGETYITTGPALTLREAALIWARISGKRPPLAFVPARYVHLLAPLSAFLSTFLPLPAILSVDAINILGVSYAGKSDKARSELGWEPRPIEDGFRHTFDWIAQKNRSLVPLTPPKKKLAAASLTGAAIGLLITWLLSRRRK